MEKPFLALLALCVALCAASGPVALAAGEPAAVDTVLERCAEAMEKVDSVAVKGALTWGIEGVINPSTTDALAIGIIREPFKARLSAQILGIQWETYAEERNGTFYLYEKNGGRWNTYADDADSQRTAVATALAGSLSAAELTDGGGTLRLSADINLRAFISHKDIEDAIAQVLGEQVRDLLYPSETVPVRVDALIDAETYTLLRVEIDLSGFLSDMLNRVTPSQPGMESDALNAQFTLSLDFADVNAVPDFEIPSEILDETKAGL